MSITETELNYVYKTYSIIAHDFDRTRWKPWSSVLSFISSIPSDKFLVDVGCGNCKNLLLKPFNSLGIDIIPEFVDIGISKGLNCILGSILDIPLENNYSDFTISTAVIHHLSTFENRIKAIQELIRITKPKGKIMIHIWAYEQPLKSPFKFTKGDNFIPWKNIKGEISAMRYYYISDETDFYNLIHFFYKEIIIDNIFLENGNWCCIFQKL